MMLYLIFIPGIVAQLFFLNYLIKIRREERIINEFCLVREHIIAFLSTEDGQILAHKDYSFARWMLEVNSITVKQFANIKHKLNITSALRNLRHIDQDVVKPRRAHRTENIALQGLYRELIGATVRGFVAYTPFFGSKIMLGFVLASARLLAKVGAKRIKHRAQEFTDRWEHIQQSEAYYCPA